MPPLPPDADFATDRGRIASPERMNRFSGYLQARFGALEAQRATWEAAVVELKAIGLSRVTEVLQPIYDNAVAIGTELEALRNALASDDYRAELVADAKAAVLQDIAEGNLYVRDGANAGLELYSGPEAPDPELAAPGAIYIYVAP